MVVVVVIIIVIIIIIIVVVIVVVAAAVVVVFGSVLLKYSRIILTLEFVNINRKQTNKTYRRAHLTCNQKRSNHCKRCPCQWFKKDIAVSSGTILEVSLNSLMARLMPLRLRALPFEAGKVYPSSVPGSKVSWNGVNRDATALGAGPTSIPSSEFEKYEVMRGNALPVNVSLMYSKLNA